MNDYQEIFHLEILQKFEILFPDLHSQKCKVVNKFTRGKRRNLSSILKYFFTLTSHNFQKSD